MIEVLFAESEAASMKAGKKKSLKREHTGWIEGTPEEVICLGFLLDIGDIRENVDSAYRKTLIHDLYTQEAWGKDPEVDVRGNEIISYRNWGEVAAEEFAGFLPYERELSREEVRMYRSLWMELQEENTPLRAIINGKIMSVGEDFYDFLIWKELTKKPIKEARLICRV